MSNQRIEALRAAVNEGRATGNFPESLIAQFERRGSLSEKQWHWVDRLANQQPEERESIKVDGLIALFNHAQEHLKHPKIWLRLADGTPLRLSVSGQRSKYPGSIQMTDGRPYYDNTWFGRIAIDGDILLSRRIDREQQAEITALLRRLADEPAKVASEYGALTGNCCFCHRELSDERSTEVGYGPVCADRYGLPWGAKAETTDISKRIAEQVENAPVQHIEEPAPLQHRAEYTLTELLAEIEGGAE